MDLAAWLRRFLSTHPLKLPTGSDRADYTAEVMARVRSLETPEAASVTARPWPPGAAHVGAGGGGGGGLVGGGGGGGGAFVVRGGGGGPPPPPPPGGGGGGGGGGAHAAPRGATD